MPTTKSLLSVCVRLALALAASVLTAAPLRATDWAFRPFDLPAPTYTADFGLRFWPRRCTKAAPAPTLQRGSTVTVDFAMASAEGIPVPRVISVLETICRAHCAGVGASVASNDCSNFFGWSGAGWGLHPLESDALSGRIPGADIDLRTGYFAFSYG